MPSTIFPDSCKKLKCTAMLFIFTATFLISFPYCVLAGEEIHLIKKGDVAYKALTKTEMWQRIRGAAEEYVVYAPIPRIALFDVTYPADEEEYKQMAGYGLLTITAISQDRGEFPLARVYFRKGYSEENLKLVKLSVSEMPNKDSVVAITFGNYVLNALYLFPMNLRNRSGQLLIDFARNRKEFVISNFPLDLTEFLPDTPPTADAPPEKAMLTLIEREIPIFSVTNR